MTIQSRVSTSFDLKRISLNISANLNRLINVNNLLISISEKSYEKVRSKNGGNKHWQVDKTRSYDILLLIQFLGIEIFHQREVQNVFIAAQIPVTYEVVLIAVLLVCVFFTQQRMFGYNTSMGNELNTVLTVTTIEILYQFCSLFPSSTTMLFIMTRRNKL